MKIILTDGEHILGPYSSVVDQGNAYLADNKELLPKNIVGEWQQQEVSDVFVHPLYVEQINNSFNNNQKKLRAQAYIKEADSLFFMSQRGEVTTQEWLDKVTEIKQRFPYK